jgi:HNH endonuclease
MKARLSGAKGMVIKGPPVVTCLYCEETKTPDKFNREHVLQEAFGRYENNFVLRDLVCRDCNKYFDKYLDGPLARDSKEGLDRFVHGGVEPKKDRKLHGTRLKLKRNGGRFDGALLLWTLDSKGTRLTAIPAPQLGFAISEDGPFEWHHRNAIPSLEVLRAKQFSYCVAGGMSNEEATVLVKRLGFDTVLATELVDPPDADGMVATTTEGRIDQTLRRAVAKIAFNYFAYRYPDIATLDHFRDIRRYIRFCEEPAVNPVKVSNDRILGELAPDVQIVGHVITTRWDGDAHQVVAQVSLFDWVQYQVTLSTSRFLFPPFIVDSGHLFNPHSKQIAELTRDRSRAMPIPLVSKEGSSA